MNYYSKEMNKIMGELTLLRAVNKINEDKIEELINNRKESMEFKGTKGEWRYSGAVISRFSSTVEKQQSFYNELKALLLKYDAELTIEDFGINWQSNEKIVVDFKYDESFFEKENTGIIPQLVLGRYENGT